MKQSHAKFQQPKPADKVPQQKLKHNNGTTDLKKRPLVD